MHGPDNYDLFPQIGVAVVFWFHLLYFTGRSISEYRLLRFILESSLLILCLLLNWSGLIGFGALSLHSRARVSPFSSQHKITYISSSLRIALLDCRTVSGVI